ncbi:dienelactone hydrolase family protein [Neobacillus sp. SuZ13]|uniref:dienelactone hydrolase family protein n=1 Tax=Neobacillus sp. SuZ13 TaxID=3047875 RepID=UPI0024BF3056|nr:dienelactone hydrolase family protein [Neobacillus sp. SuZ13]WHY64847.1 dienelactone hydrolase family protein [Neobacillus sp. SuZ13]
MSIQSEWQSLNGTNGKISAYISSIEPVNEPQPTVLVIQEIWGVDAHIQNVAERFATAGYVAIAPDLFADQGVRPEELSEEMIAEAKNFLHSIPHTSWFNPSERENAILQQPSEKQETLRTTLNTLFGKLDQSKSETFIRILKDSADYARNLMQKTKGMPVTSVGFCLGGALSAALATQDPNHAGSIVFYGRPPHQNIANIECPVLGFYGGEDKNITNLIPDFEEEMRKHEKSFEAIVYPNAHHAFYNDTNPTYHPKYARDAFARTLTFLNRVTNT